MKTILAMLFAFFVAFSIASAPHAIFAKASAPHEQDNYWIKTFNGTTYHIASGTAVGYIRVLPNGSILTLNVYVGGVRIYLKNGHMVTSPIWVRNSDEGISIMKLSPKGRIEWATSTKKWAGYLPKYFTVTRNGSIAVASVIISPPITTTSIIPGWSGQQRLLITYLTRDGKFLKLMHYYPPYLFEWISGVVLTPQVIVMSGAFASPSANGYLVVGMNYKGELLWGKEFKDVKVSHLAGSSEEGFFALGETNSGELWVAKIDPKGRTLWQRVYGDLNNYTVSSVTPYKGGLVIAGSASNKGWLALISPNGNVIWSRTYGVSGGCGIASVSATLEGNIVAAGWIKENKRSDAWLIRVDGNGNVVWSRSYHENGSSKLAAVTVEPNGDIIAGGGVIYKHFNGESIVSLVLKLPPSGYIPGCKECQNVKTTVNDVHPEVQGVNLTTPLLLEGWGLHTVKVSSESWNSNVKRFTEGTYWKGSYDAYVNAARPLPNGNVVIAGWRNIKVKKGKKQEKEAFVAELRRNGSVIWSRTYGNNSAATDLTIAKNGDLFVVGYTIRDGVFSEGWVMKLSPSGEVLWCKAYDNVVKASHVMAYKYRNLMIDDSVMVYGMRFYADAVPATVGVDGKGNVIVGGNLRNLGVAFVMKLSGSGRLEWIHSFGSGTLPGGWYVLKTLKVKGNGNIILTGQTLSFGVPSAWICELDGEGKVLWHESYSWYGSGVKNGTEATSVAITPDGYIIVGGNVINGSVEWIMKLSSNGNPVWKKAFSFQNGSMEVHGIEVAQAPNGQLVLSAYGKSKVGLVMLGLSDNGRIIWQREYPVNSPGGGVIALPDGLLAWVTMNNETFFLRTSPNGYLPTMSSPANLKTITAKIMQTPTEMPSPVHQIDWEGAIPLIINLSGKNSPSRINSTEAVYSVVSGLGRLPNGDLVASGYFTLKNGSGYSYITVISRTGKTIWLRVYSGGRITTIKAMSVTKMGYIIGAGVVNSTSNSSSTLWIFEMSPTGQMVWQKAYEVPGIAVPSSVIVTDGHVFVGGFSLSLKSAKEKHAWMRPKLSIKEQGWILGLNGEGELLWVRFYTDVIVQRTLVALPNGDVEAIGEYTKFHSKWTTCQLPCLFRSYPYTTIYGPSNWLIEVSPNGSQKLIRGCRIAGAITTAQLTKGGEIVATGNVEGDRWITVGVNPNGSVTWQKMYYAKNYNVYPLYIKALNGNVIEVGTAIKKGNSNEVSGFVLMADDHGKVEWARTVLSNASFTSMLPSKSEDTLIVGGRTGNFGLIAMVNLTGTSNHGIIVNTNNVSVMKGEIHEILWDLWKLTPWKPTVKTLCEYSGVLSTTTYTTTVSTSTSTSRITHTAITSKSSISSTSSSSKLTNSSRSSHVPSSTKSNRKRSICGPAFLVALALLPLLKRKRR